MVLRSSRAGRPFPFDMPPGCDCGLYPQPAPDLAASALAQPSAPNGSVDPIGSTNDPQDTLAPKPPSAGHIISTPDEEDTPACAEATGEPQPDTDTDTLPLKHPADADTHCSSEKPRKMPRPRRTDKDAVKHFTVLQMTQVLLDGQNLTRAEMVEWLRMQEITTTGSKDDLVCRCKVICEIPL